MSDLTIGGAAWRRRRAGRRAGSPAAPLLIGAPRAGHGSSRSRPTAAYLATDDAAVPVLCLAHPDAVRLPCALVLRPNRDRPLAGLRAGQPGTVGRRRRPHRRRGVWRVARWWRPPAPPRPASAPADAVRRRRAGAVRCARPGGWPTRSTRARAGVAGLVTAAARRRPTPRRPSPACSAAGPGLTPIGDDVLAGALVTVARARPPVAAAAGRRGDRPRPGAYHARSRPRCCAHAARGECVAAAGRPGSARSRRRRRPGADLAAGAARGRRCAGSGTRSGAGLVARRHRRRLRPPRRRCRVTGGGVRHLEVRRGIYRDSVQLMQVSRRGRRLVRGDAGAGGHGHRAQPGAAGRDGLRPRRPAPDPTTCWSRSPPTTRRGWPRRWSGSTPSWPRPARRWRHGGGGPARTADRAAAHGRLGRPPLRRRGSRWSPRPGRYAFVEAMDALEAGASVMVFSDNVPVAQEVRLKERAGRARPARDGSGLRHRRASAASGSASPTWSGPGRSAWSPPPAPARSR